MEGNAMNLERLARSGLKRIADRVAWTWIAAAPLVVLLGASAGLVDIGGPPAFAAEEPPSTRCPELCDEKIDLSKVGSGELLLKTPDGHVPLPMLDLEVRLEVTGMMVHGTLVQSLALRSHLGARHENRTRARHQKLTGAWHRYSGLAGGGVRGVLQ